MDLNIIWFILVGVLLTGYAILDGFDLGVGALHLLTKTDEDRRVLINSIGPVWDGNEVWLVTAGGALFAAFPEVYATVFSGFYIAFMLLLFMLIFRAIAIEFRSKHTSTKWRTSWDVVFSVSSIIIIILMGVALGNIITGIPLGSDKEFIGTFFGLLKPYPILIGITTLALFIMHGAIYLSMKTEGELQAKVKLWVNKAIIFFVICFVITTVVTLIFYPNMITNFKESPELFAIPIFNILSLIYIPIKMKREKDFRAFLLSSFCVALLMLTFAIGIFPNIVLSNPVVENSLNLYNAASSQKTLMIMLIIAIIGMPLVIAYTTIIYKVYKGKVKLDETSY
jgi:cytochrome bd ubiquinol oxidase subunit II